MYIILLILWGEFMPSRFSKNLNYKLGSIGQMQLRLEEIKTVKDIDVLFVGSSTAYRGFDPRIFKEHGIEVFNLGSSAQTPVQTNYLLERFLKQVNPELLVIDVNPLMFSIDGVESALDIISNDDFNGKLIRMGLRVNHLKVYHTLFYAWYVDFFRDKNYQASTVRNGDKYISGGYVEHELTYFKNLTYNKQTWEYNDKQLEAFYEIIQKLEHNSINYIIVQTPITPSLYFSYTNNAILDTFLTNKGTYYNFNKLISFDDSLHFLDAYHLNQKGVDIYNDELSKILLQYKVNP
ncbi:MAG: hypothetical protein ACOCWG_00330 [bacterium]